MEKVIEYIEKNSIVKYEKNVSLANHTTYKVGGNAKLFVYPKDREKLVSLLRFIKDEKIKYKILGNGSNTLVSDKEYDGVIIKLYCLDKVTIFKNILYFFACFFI